VSTNMKVRISLNCVEATGGIKKSDDRVPAQQPSSRKAAKI